MVAQREREESGGGKEEKPPLLSELVWPSFYLRILCPWELSCRKVNCVSLFLLALS